MERGEWLEWVGLILVIVAWWPIALFAWDPLYYRIPLYVFSGAVLATVLVRRVRRMHGGLRASREMVDLQRGGQPLPPLAGPPSRAGAKPRDGEEGD